MSAVTARQAQVELEGKSIALHNLDKIFWPRLGLTKGDLVNYYLALAPYVLPRLAGRPFIMKPFPNGASGRSYFRWEAPGYAPSWIRHWRYEPLTAEEPIDMLVVDSLPALIWIANQACIELHPWLSRYDEPQHPDVVVFDLDPGRGAGFAACLEVASWLHEALDRQGVRCYAKTSGGDGLHVLVPVERHYTFKEVREWVQAVARPLAAAQPGEITLDKARDERRGKVLVDYSQNGLGKSVVAAYSARATPEATVSAPLTWKEVARRRVRPGDFTILSMPERVRKTGDLLAPLQQGQPLPPVP